jgi:predicted nuclease of predicted toxin-antitoxin system
MKLLFDQNISRKLAKELEDLFPEASHVYYLDLQQASDKEIWEYAKNNDFIIVTQDSDFNERGLIHGYPPKVVWLRTGNTSTQNIKYLLVKHSQDIVSFGQDKTLGCFIIYEL